jgi:hypothetical protein
MPSRAFMLAPSPYIRPPCSWMRATISLQVLVKQPQRVGVGEHHAHQPVAVLPGQAASRGLQVHVAPVVGGDFHDSQPAHSRAGGIGAVGGVGDQDDVAVGLPPVALPGAHDQHAGQFAMSPCRWLQADGGEAPDFFQELLQEEHQRQGTLHCLLVLVRVEVDEAGQAGHFFVDFGVVLHRAGAPGGRSPCPPRSSSGRGGCSGG